MKKLILSTALAVITLGFGACKTQQTGSQSGKAGACEDCCKSEGASAKKTSSK